MHDPQRARLNRAAILQCGVAPEALICEAGEEVMDQCEDQESCRHD